MLESTKRSRKSLIPIPFEEEKIPSSCKILSMPNEWVSVALKEEMTQWCPVQPLMIAAPTGTGKTTFTADIVKFWRKVKPNQKILLLVNRTAIAMQQKRELTKKLGSAWGRVEDVHAFELVDDFPDVGLTVKTYQAFTAQHHTMNLREYGWVIFDEAHYFLADSIFNEYLDQIFWKLPTLFAHARRVYMTATPGAVLPEICEAEKKNLIQCEKCQRCFWRDSLSLDLCGALRVYDFPGQFDRIELFYFREREEILPLVQKASKEKFLVFTSRRETDADSNSKSYVNLLQENKISVKYLDRFSKDSDAWKAVCQEGQFNAQALVCTSVLDCGVSFHDDALKHIVVETTDKTEFLQMIGRKRLKEGERLKVYIRVFDKGALCRQLRNTENQLQFIYRARRAITERQADKLIFRAWHDQDEERLYARLLNYHGHGLVSVKETAEHCLRWRKGTINRLLRDMSDSGDDSALPKLAHEWLGQEGAYSETRWLDFDEKGVARKQLENFLEEHVGSSFDKAAWDSFSKEVVTLIASLASFAHDKKRMLDSTAVNNRFNALGLQYVVVKNKNMYKLDRREENCYDVQ